MSNKKSQVTGSGANISSKNNSQVIDSNRLLSLCHKIRECMGKLELCIRVTQVKLISAGYVRRRGFLSSAGGEEKDESCFDKLTELANLSNRLCQLLEKLQLRLASDRSDNTEGATMGELMGAQQLAFFTSQWHDNFTPRLRDTFELADKVRDLDAANVKRSGQFGAGARTGKGRLRKNVEDDDDEDKRMREALLRLRESMRENERLIEGIASNLEHTKITLDTIHDSFQGTRLGLISSEKYAEAATSALHRASRCAALAALFFICLLSFGVYYLLSLLL